MSFHTLMEIAYQHPEVFVSMRNDTAVAMHVLHYGQSVQYETRPLQNVDQASSQYLFSFQREALS